VRKIGKSSGAGLQSLAVLTSNPCGHTERYLPHEATPAEHHPPGSSLLDMKPSDAACGALFVVASDGRHGNCPAGGVFRFKPRNVGRALKMGLIWGMRLKGR
jgi:hypothetical protein